MKLWLLSQGVHCSYDTFDSMVVAAETEENARKIHPEETWEIPGNDGWANGGSFTWANFPDQVDVEYLGDAAPETKAGIILASYNAG